MSVQELAQHFGCGVTTIWRWNAKGHIPKAIKIGGLTRWRRADIEALTASEAA
jgi:excisionase family DNA binding protein